MQSIKSEFVVLSDETACSWPAKKPDRTIDFILVDKAHAGGVKVLRREVIAAPEATDHAAVIVDLVLK